jgi:hypothetical protein
LRSVVERVRVRGEEVMACRIAPRRPERHWG